MANELNGKRIAFIATHGVEQIELTESWSAARNAGATTDLISLQPGTIQGFNNLDKADTFTVDGTFDEARPEDYDGLVIPGGVANPDFMRMDQRAVAFVRAFVDAEMPVAVICHGPWMLVEADVVRGRKVTSWPSLRTDLRNAGAEWVDQEVVVDGAIVTSRKPDDLPAFCRTMVAEFVAGMRDRAAVSTGAGS
jgi:protease I